MRISKYTPSLLAPEDLEAIFVQRHSLAEQLVELVSDSVLSKSKHYSLLIGPRGIGKTHLVSLIYHRIVAESGLQDKLAIAWLREEEWGVGSFLDLVLRILRSLHEAYPGTKLDESMGTLYGQPPQDAEASAIKLLKDVLGDRTLLLLMENLDDIFQGMGDEGQKKLRSFLQETGCCTIVATSQSLFNGVKLQTSPFYGFFRIRHLKDFSVDEAIALLKKIAKMEGNEELAQFLISPVGRSRMQAVHHLVGGNPRFYIIFSHYLTQKSLEDLVEPFLAMVNELVPHYQTQMQLLSSQQRKIVSVLGQYKYPQPVKDIAQQCFASQQTTASQLKELRERGYVQAEKVGRQSFYELREPFMRVCISVQEEQGQAMKEMINFLKYFLMPHGIDDFEKVENALQTIFQQSSDSSLWEKSLSQLLSTVEQEDTINGIPQGLTQQSKQLISEMVSQTAADKWYEIWKALVGDRDEFLIPLRLLNGVVEYKKAPDDPRVFLTLAIEERKILKQLLGVTEEIPR